MNIDSSIFKAYDIRGVYPGQINAELVYAIARAYAEFLKPKTVAVGCDMRLSGEEFKQAAIRGLVDSGVSVIDIGLVSTDTMYFAVPFLGADGGLQATASHNPKEFGGLKMVREQGRPISGDTGIFQIRDRVVSGISFPETAEKGTVEKRDITEDYYRHVLKTFSVASIKPLKVVANTNFGMATPAIAHLEKLLPVRFLEVINGQLDGNFPKGRPDPLIPENRDETIVAVKKLGADLGVAWDGDADRVFFFDEHGEFVKSPHIIALLSEYYLRKYPGSAIIHDPRIIRVIDDVVGKAGGRSLVNKSGHSFIKERMIAEDAVFGGETSGHYYFRDNFYLDNGLFPFMAVLEILSADSRPFSEILKPFRERYFISEEINLQVKDSAAVLAALKQKYGDSLGAPVDGYDFNYPDWRFNVRLSNTEPLLRINLEAYSQELLDEKTAEVTGLARANA